jgi:ribosomal protein S18 acetylase RimI-like enzyme
MTRLSQVNYRLYIPADFGPLYAIEEACFQPPLRFGRRYMRQLVDSREAATWIAEQDGQMAGFAIVEWTREQDEIVAYIETLEVAPASRRQGVGGELLQRVEASAQSAGAALIGLHVDAENAAAIRLYETHGYLLQGKQENYYARSRAALVYRKRLESREPAY